MKVRPCFRIGSCRSTLSGRFSDESFRRWDIQFNYPQIRIEFDPLLAPIRDCFGSIRRTRPDLRPAVATVAGKGPFHTGEMVAATAHEQDQRSSIRIPLAKNRTESTSLFRTAEKTAGLEMRG